MRLYYVTLSLSSQNFSEITWTEVILEIIIVALAGIPSSAVLFLFFCSLCIFLFSSYFPVVLQSCPAHCEKHQIQILGLLLLIVLLFFSQIHPTKYCGWLGIFNLSPVMLPLLLSQLKFNQCSNNRVLHTASQSEHFLSPSNVLWWNLPGNVIKS